MSSVPIILPQPVDLRKRPVAEGKVVGLLTVTEHHALFLFNVNLHRREHRSVWDSSQHGRAFHRPG
jgi:hypothetical protein